LVRRCPIPHRPTRTSSPIYAKGVSPKPSVAPRFPRGEHAGLTCFSRSAHSLNQTFPAPSPTRGGMGSAPHAKLQAGVRTKSLSHFVGPLPIAVSLLNCMVPLLRASSFWFPYPCRGGARGGAKQRQLLTATKAQRDCARTLRKRPNAAEQNRLWTSSRPPAKLRGHKFRRF